VTPRRVAVLAGAVGAEILAAGAVFSAASHVAYQTGLYWAVTTATTVGYGDVAPHGTAARTVAVVVMLTAIPLLGALFAALTSLHVARHVHDAEQRIHARLDEHGRALGIEPKGK
jgi:voltage-gated potassium channel Kch